jgi:hypothetical protein
MPIDYANTIIYKITCKDKAVTDLYVGHTTDFVQRKRAHEYSCLSNKSVNHKCKVYEIIRANGGWSNWKMEIINFFECKDLYEAKEKEQEYFILLNANLNSIEPMPKKKEKKEKVIIKPEVAIIINTIVPPFSCSSCNIVTNNKKDFNKHLLTRKHLKCVNFQQIDEIIPKKISHQNCKICNKMFVSRSGLWRHNKKTCTEIKPQTNTSDDLSNIVLEFIKISKELQKQNTDLQKQILECMNNK